MSHFAWRIGVEAKSYSADDMTGAGAKKDGGRWNEVGTAVVYTSSSRALACLETVVHLNAGALPLNRYLVEVEIPDDLWKHAEIVTPRDAPVGWDAEPAGRASIDLGTAWALRSSSALLIVPSAIVPEEQNVLINPLHSDAWKISARKIRRWTYDPRLVK